MFCVRCGTKLDQGRCHNCGFFDNTYKPVMQEPKEAELKNQSVKKKLNKKWLFAIVAAVIIGIGCFTTIYLMKDARYNEAVYLFDEGRIDKAAAKFEKLGGFRDSENYLMEANEHIPYNIAVSAYEDKEYEVALELFEALGGYKDSSDYAELCSNYVSYKDGENLLHSGDFEQAKIIFESLGDFEDSTKKAQLCQNSISYKQAESLLHSGDYSEAEAIFMSLENFEDSNDKAQECRNNKNYIEAQNHFEEEHYDKALRLFESMPGFKDSDDLAVVCSCIVKYDKAKNLYDAQRYEAATELLKEVDYKVLGSSLDFSEYFSIDEMKYIQGQCYYDQELFCSAYNAFLAADSYKDAEYMAGSCIQPSKTELLNTYKDFTQKSVKVALNGPLKTTHDAYVEVTQDGVLVCTCLVKHGERLTVSLPEGTYVFSVYYGIDWFGEYENFGKSSFDDFIYQTLSSGQNISIDLSYIN